MKTRLIAALFILNFTIVNAQKVSWIYTTESEKWTNGTKAELKPSDETADITIIPDEKFQEIKGFGACFNELGWEALLSLDSQKREKILHDLFSKEGVNFSVCRIPLGSNDYSLSYYSYDDVPEDFLMKNFNIDRDRYILVPYIKAAKKIRPDLKIWASPWSPPAWMKVNNHYAVGSNTDVKRMDPPGRAILNNATAFKMEQRYLAAYSLYFSKFVQAYKKEGIDISLVMVQNEPIYQPHWQSCTWRPEDLAYFISDYLGPKFQEDSLSTEIWLGTVNSSDPNYAGTILRNKNAAKFIKGVGYQWDAKYAIGKLHNEFPQYSTMQTESECGNGENNWGSAEYTWSLIHKYLSNGINYYMYWNMILDKSGKSTWGWTQNMMISIDKETGEVVYNPEYYLMKHLSHYVLPGAHRIKTSDGDDHLAFQNPDGTIVLMIMNREGNKNIKISVNGKEAEFNIKAKSINTFTWK